MEPKELFLVERHSEGRGRVKESSISQSTDNKPTNVKEKGHSQRSSVSPTHAHTP